MRFVTYNIHYGFGRDGRNDLERIAAAVDGADVIAFQEVDRYWPRSGMSDQLARLGKLLPDYWIAFGANIDLHSAAGFPGEVGTPRRQFGNAIFSRRPILSSVNVLLPRPPTAPQTMQRGALEAVVATDHSGPVRVYSVHLDYLAAATRAAQIDRLSAHHTATISEGGSWNGTHPVNDGWVVGDEPSMPADAIILGDFNIDGAGPEYSDLARRLDGFADAWPRGGVGGGASKDGQRIDHCWVTSNLAGAVRTCRVDAAAAGSDHQPIWFHLDV